MLYAYGANDNGQLGNGNSGYSKHTSVVVNANM
ncbi:MAG: hypothetical protein KJ737_18900 [Proteobacteria bacterium]|nr:hypothetical protein [Pseudomonadota bacterium]